MPARVFTHVADLATYPQWLGIVHSATAVDDDVWEVELGARLGPLRRTKRVRMVRTECDPSAGVVRFERMELDGREHSAWRLHAAVAPAEQGSRLTMQLHYGGSAWLPGLEAVLAHEVRRAGARLRTLLEH